MAEDNLKIDYHAPRDHEVKELQDQIQALKSDLESNRHRAQEWLRNKNVPDLCRRWANAYRVFRSSQNISLPNRSIHYDISFEETKPEGKGVDLEVKYREYTDSWPSTVAKVVNGQVTELDIKFDWVAVFKEIVEEIEYEIRNVALLEQVVKMNSRLSNFKFS